MLLSAGPLSAQVPDVGPGGAGSGGAGSGGAGSGGAGMAVDASEISSIMTDEPEAPDATGSAPSGIDLLTLISSGGKFMIPIGIMSFLVVALAVERFVSLRRGKVVPRGLERELRSELDPIERFNPVEALRVCRKYPSPAGRVIEAMLLRTGQPLADVERAGTEAVEREAERFASPIRWLTLAAAATPLMGLLGTVWGMIVAFHESTTLTADRSRSEQLSEGIYTALVTTLAGLVVAIPAAILALYLENRLIALFHRLEKFAFDVGSALTRFTGKRRLDPSGKMLSIDGAAPVQSAGAVPPEPPPRPASKQRDQARTG